MKAAGQGVDGISFAIPIDFAMRIVHQMETKGYVRRSAFVSIASSHQSANNTLYMQAVHRRASLDA